MKRIRALTVYSGVVALACSGLWASPAAAQATRTWVSGVGDDANPCSRTAPCKTFAGAISKTATNGEINCLDPAGFGAVTITKSISIVCDHTLGGILSANTTGVLINGANADVFLSGLDINGAGTTGLNGIRFIQGHSLHVQNSTLRGSQAANGTGLLFAPNGAARLYMYNVDLSQNGSGATGGGVVIVPPAGGSARALLNNVRSHNNANNALRIDVSSSAAAGVGATIVDSEFSGSTNGVTVTSTAAAGATVILIRSTMENNTNGINAIGPATSVFVNDSTITLNNTGLVTSGGGAIRSYGNNVLDANTNVSSFTGVVLPRF